MLFTGIGMRNFKQIREETGHYAKAEEHLSKANDADANGKMASFHAHMADHHDELSQWHESKGRSATADKHADKADYHHEKSIDIGRGVHEARDTKQELRDAMSRHTRSAIAAKSEGDNDRVKVHQAYINKIKDKLGKMEAMGEEYIEEASPRAQAAFDELDNEISGKPNDFEKDADASIKAMRDKTAAKRAAENPAQRDDRRAATAARMATPAPDGSKRVSQDDQMDRDIKWFKSQTAKPKVAEERTEIKNAKGEVTSWKDESDWRKTSKVKSGIGKVTNLSDKARRETEKLAKKGVGEQFIGTGDSSSMQMSKDIATNRARLNMMRSVHGDNFTDKRIPDHDEHDIKITPNDKGGYRTSVTVTPRSAKKPDVDSSPLTEPKDKTNNTKSYMDSSPLKEPKDKTYKPKMQDMSEEVDDEGSMAKGQLNRMIDQATSLVRIMDDKKQLDGWVQSKLTMASDYLDSAHDYLMHSKQDVDKK